MCWKIKIFLLGIVLLLGCSQDDESGNLGADVSEFPDFSTLSFEGNNRIIHYRFESVGQVGTSLNLQETDNIGPVIQRLQPAGDVVGLYLQNKVWLKNLRTGSLLNRDNFFTESENEFRSWSINSEQQVFSGYHDSQGFDNFYVRTQNLLTNSISNIEIGALGQNNNPLYGKDRLVFYQNDFMSSGAVVSRLVMMNTETASSFGIKTLAESAIFGVVFGDQNDLIIFQANDMYSRYSLEDFSFLDSAASEFNMVLNGQEVLLDGKLYFSLDYAQPSAIEASPAVYDLNTQLFSRVDILESFEAYRLEQEWPSLAPVDFVYVPAKDVWLISYRNTTGTSLEQGGVFMVSAQGEILSNIALEDPPAYLALHD